MSSIWRKKMPILHSVGIKKMNAIKFKMKEVFIFAIATVTVVLVHGWTYRGACRTRTHTQELPDSTINVNAPL